MEDLDYDAKWESNLLQYRDINSLKIQLIDHLITQHKIDTFGMLGPVECSVVNNDICVFVARVKTIKADTIYSLADKLLDLFSNHKTTYKLGIYKVSKDENGEYTVRYAINVK